MKKLLLALICCSSLTLVACATNNNNAQSGINTYGNTPDSPNVSSKAASNEEFPQENQL